MCDEGNPASTRHLCGYSKQAWRLEAVESARVRLTDLKLPDLLVNCDFNANTEITSSYPSPDLETECRDACLERDGATDIVAKEIIFRPEDLATLAVDPCTDGSQCASGVCGEEGMCREVCPFEEAIANIQPNCKRIRVSSDFVCSELSTLRQFGQWTAATEFGAGPLINLLTRDTVPDFDPTELENLGRRIDSALGEQLQGNLRQVRAARPRWIVLVGILPNDMPAWMRP
jgi:hypothetical protein